jgi:hypothetical protein
VFEEVTDEAGALPWTAQRIGRTVYLDRRGMRDLAATAAFGNFKAGALSELFDRFLEAKRRAGAQPVASLRCKTKSQYRVYYDDGTGFAVFMGGKTPQMLPFETDSLRVYATFTGEMADGSEGMFACGEDGFLYRLDSGTNFDGVGVRGFIMTPFNHIGQIRKNKRFLGVDVELEAAPRTRLGLLAQFDYGDGEQPVSGDQDFTVALVSATTSSSSEAAAFGTRRSGPTSTGAAPTRAWPRRTSPGPAATSRSSSPLSRASSSRRTRSKPIPAAFLARLRTNCTVSWVRLVQALNWLALSLAGLVSVIDAMYHNEVSAAFGHLPPIAKLAALGVWAALVHYGLRRAAKAA